MESQIVSNNNGAFQGKKYQVKVRGYVKVNGQKYYGNWSKIKVTKKIK